MRRLASVCTIPILVLGGATGCDRLAHAGEPDGGTAAVVATASASARAAPAEKSASASKPTPSAAGSPSANGFVAAPDPQNPTERVEQVPLSAAVDSDAPKSSACPDDMVLVAGNFCRAVEQRCLEYTTRPEGERDPSRCARFQNPTRCISDAPSPRAMRFCMDRYEYPNQKGELPITLVDWTEAGRLCAQRGRRLCTESEFNFACEGEEMLPYATGYERDAKKCNIDRPFHRRRIELKPRVLCNLDPACSAEFSRLDQREPAGSRTECVSPFGVHDLNGNVNEWVSMPWKQPPHRAAIKGGWWGPVRNRCRPIVTSHDERYVGYEVGFRCCRDAAAAGAGRPAAVDAR
jgi:sulfatase modifying factor 1